MSKVTTIHNSNKDRVIRQDGRYVLTFHFTLPLTVDEYHFAEIIFNQPFYVKTWNIKFVLTTKGFQAIMHSEQYFKAFEKRIMNRIAGKVFLINKKVQDARQRRVFMKRLIAENPPVPNVSEQLDKFINIMGD